MRKQGERIIMSPYYFIAIVLFVFSADCTVDDYRFVSEINGFLKFHRIPSKWQDARLQCKLEGGVLASPTDENMVKAMKDKLTKDNRGGAVPEIVYTGIHATYSDGDFTTITGIPLSKLDVQWNSEVDNYKGRENCLVMYQSGGLADIDCDSYYPYFCFKSMEDNDAHECGPEHNHSDYRLEPRTGSCYKFHTEGRSWPNAFKTCLAEDAHLAIINSQVESQVLSQLFEEYEHDDIPGDFHKDAASIGFTLWKEVGDWYTIHGESLVEAGFSTFNAGEPNNIDQKEWCGSVWRTGLMNDHNCDRLLTFICEKSPSQSQKDEELEYQ